MLNCRCLVSCVLLWCKEFFFCHFQVHNRANLNRCTPRCTPRANLNSLKSANRIRTCELVWKNRGYASWVAATIIIRFGTFLAHGLHSWYYLICLRSPWQCSVWVFLCMHAVVCFLCLLDCTLHAVVSCFTRWFALKNRFACVLVKGCLHVERERERGPS